MVKLLTSPLWEQMDLLSEPAKEDIGIRKLDALASELVTADIVTVKQVIKAHRLNKEERKLLMELLDINYILDVLDNADRN